MQAHTFKELVYAIIGVIGYAVPLIFTLTLITFLWGMVQYIISENEEKVEAARNYIIYGIIGIAVMAGVWGIVYAITRTFFGIPTQSQTQTDPNIPNFSVTDTVSNGGVMPDNNPPIPGRPNTNNNQGNQGQPPSANLGPFSPH